MTDRFPRAPRLQKNSCLCTAALLESAQRVFLYHTTSPIHWMDLCTLIDSVVLYDSIAFPLIHAEYAAPLLEPLLQSGLADPWYPEAHIIQVTDADTKEAVWGDGGTSDAAQAVRLFLGGWPDRNYEALSAEARAAVDGIAHGFAEPALMPEDKEASVLLWGPQLRMRSDPTFEHAAALRLHKGVTDLERLPPDERSAYAVPHASNQDIYNHYATNVRALANATHATVAKSLIEEPYFDSISLETAARETLHGLLKTAFHQNITAAVGKYVRTVPISPFSAMALSQAKSLNDVLPIALDLRVNFRAYRDLLGEHRARLATVEAHQTLELTRELAKMEASFQQALKASLKRVSADDVSVKLVVDGLHGVEQLAKDAVGGDYAGFLERMATPLLNLLKSWWFMNYGGVYNIVSHFPKVQQLGGAALRLTHKELDSTLMSVVADAAKRITAVHSLPREEG